jgi:hypothetical protein
MIADEAIGGRPAMHGRITTPTVLDLVLAASSVLDRIRVAVFAANEALRRRRIASAIATTTANHHADGSDGYICQPKSLHRFSPRTGSSPFS